jgi:hypothetical protein
MARRIRRPRLERAAEGLLRGAQVAQLAMGDAEPVQVKGVVPIQGNRALRALHGQLGVTIAERGCGEGVPGFRFHAGRIRKEKGSEQFAPTPLITAP